MTAGLLFGSAIGWAALALLGPWLCRHFSAGSFRTRPEVWLVPIAVILLAGFLGFRFGQFYIKHWHGMFPGSIGNRAAKELAQYHTVLLLVCIVLIAAELRNGQRATAIGNRIAGCGGMAAAVCAAGAVVMSLPRSGNEGIILWMLLGPACGLAMLFLFVLSVRRVVQGARHRNRNGVQAFNAPLCPCCSYCLLGNHSGICPECGRPVPDHLRALTAESTSAQPSMTPRNPAAALAFVLGTSAVVLVVLSIAPPMIQMVPLPGLSTFLIWRFEPWWLELVMGVALIAAAKALPAQRWAVAVCVLWSIANGSLGVFNVARAMPLWQNLPAPMFSAGRFVPWLVLHFAWSAAAPALLLYLIHKDVKSHRGRELRP